MKMLKRHLKAAHGLTPEAYRHKWGLPEDYPVTAPNYSESKSAYAKDMQFGVTGAKASPKRRGRRTKAE
ncbi:transcriptional regulator [Salipiger mucosus DSM 16094]|uniref:Transcriptional regulator n=2 Tax=Salipiger mucosus TaxID=263378 RepID=S9QWJ4_9RHOB|nr:transcriptional regulator [Salipiger mucosus DSM 16094]